MPKKLSPSLQTGHTWCLSAYCVKGSDCSIQLPSTPEPCSTMISGSTLVLHVCARMHELHFYGTKPRVAEGLTHLKDVTCSTQ